MVIIGMIDRIGDIKTMIGVLMGRLEDGRQFTIGWGAGSVCMTYLGNVLVISQETKRNMKRWQMHGSLMSLYFAARATRRTEWGRKFFQV